MDPKTAVTIGLAAPVASIFLQWDIPAWGFGALAIWAYMQLDNHLIDKSEVSPKPAQNLGPQRPLIPQEKEWDVDQDGNLIARYPTPQYTGGKRQ